MTQELKFYFAYTSPVSYLAKDPAYALERSHNVRVRYIPFGVDIRRVYGDVPTRGERDRRKLRYLYHDARRMARERGVVIYPPRQIFSARRAFYGGFCAEDQGLFRPYSDRVYQRFWKHELEVENPEVLAAILEEVGADTATFRRWIEDEESEAKPRLKRGFEEAAATLRAPGPGCTWTCLAASGSPHSEQTRTGSNILLQFLCSCSIGRPRESTMWTLPQCTIDMMIG